MEKVISVFQWLVANYAALLSGIIAVLSGVIAISLVIPGEQPEKTLKKVVDFLSKFSKK